LDLGEKKQSPFNCHMVTKINIKLAMATKTNLGHQICGLIDIGHHCFQLPFGD
jgi:hypothetical protein